MRALLSAALLLSALHGFAQDAAAPREQEPSTTLKVDVRLVNVFATVVDQHGAPVGGLERGDFEVFEDGEPQQVAIFERESELPLSIVLALDASLSVRGQLKLQTDAARRFVSAILRPVDSLALFQFDETVTQLVPFTADVRRIERGLGRVRVGSGTAMFDAVYLGAQTLRRRDGRKVMLLISDGGDTVSQVKYAEALRAAQQAEAIIYSVIVVPIEAQAGRNIGGEHALIHLAQNTGGKHYYAGPRDSMDEIFARISEELRTQYLLAYYPTRRFADSRLREIEVRVRPREEPGGEGAEARTLSVRHRRGYYTYQGR
jgi:Ca-activated chloride channel family protein